MAGYTDTAFRQIAKQFGAAMVVTEMVSARALLEANPKTYQLLSFTELERPIGVQLFGGDPEVMGEASKKVMDQIHPDVLDVNFGCPVGKILKCDAGASVLKEPQRAGKIVKAMIQATQNQVPVTVKTRAGFDKFDNAVFEVLQSVQEAGASALTIHARTRNQMFEGQANWDIIAKLKQQSRIPIIGNGDVQSAQNAYRLFQETHCDGIMIGRGSMGNPWIFKEINEYLEKGVCQFEISKKFQLNVALSHLKSAVQIKGMPMGLMEMRKHLTHYLRGFQGARELRQSILTSMDLHWIIQTLEQFIEKMPDHQFEETLC
jgi:nifR3 family TIM-barrel protein